MRNRRYAVTGGMGSGKSAVCDIIRAQGIPVFSCDEISHGLWREEEYRRGLSERFPACCEGGEISKPLLSALVFSDGEALERLNEYAHAEIMARLKGLSAGMPVCFCEVPLLFEGGFEGEFDGVIAVLRDPEARISSVLSRDGLSREQALARMERQFDYARIGEKSCLTIENNGSLQELEERTKAVLRQLL